MDIKMPQLDLKLDITYKQIINLALPISLAIFIPQFNQLANAFFLGNYDASGDMLAMGGITGVYYLIFAVMGYGLNSGVQALISRRAGEDRIDEISKLFWNGVRMALMIAAFAIFLSYTIGSFLLQYSLKSGDLAAKAVEFLKIRIWGLPFLLMFQMCTALLISSNNSKFLLYAVVAETATNIFFDYVLIYGKWGFPQLGFNGAAYASIITEGVAIGTSFMVLYYAGIFEQLKLNKNQGFDTKIIRLIAVQSLPLVFQLVISIASWEFFYIMVERHSQILRGDNLESAVSNVMRNFFGVFGCTTWALASTCTTMVSNVIGQGLQERVMEVVNRVMRLSLGFSVIFVAIINLFPESILWFFGQNQAFVALAVPIVRVVSIAILLMSLGAIAINAINGTGNTRVTLYLEIIAIVFYCGYTYVVFEVWKAAFVLGWACEVIYWLGIFLMAYGYLMRGKWKNKVI